MAEKLKALREKLGKSVEAQTAAEKKAKDIRAEIAKCEKFLHDEEVRAMDAICSKNNISFAEAAAFIEAVVILIFDQSVDKKSAQKPYMQAFA